MSMQGGEVNTETAGGTRYATGKPQMWMAPWKGMLEVCRVAEYGGKKYAPLDWQNGQSFSTLLNSAMRHMLLAMANPQAHDAESGRLHLGHAAWNLLAVLHFLEEGKSGQLLDDITPWRGVKAETKIPASISSEAT